MQQKSDSKQTINQDTLGKNFEDRLPKNVRQIGNISSSVKIYIEDYAFNYLKRMEKEAESGLSKKAAVLVGEKHTAPKTTYYFISGVVELNVDVTERPGQMSEEQKKQLARTIENYFQEENSCISQLGWAYWMLNTSDIPEACEQFHRENFGTNNTLLFAFYEDGEENFYINENGKLKKQTGYYVYFQRSPGMQQYVQDHQANACVEMESIPKGNGNSESYRLRLAKRKEEVQRKHLITFLYTASTFLVMVVIVLGITLINHYDKLKDMQGVVASLSKSVVNGQPQVTLQQTATPQAAYLFATPSAATELPEPTLAAALSTELPVTSEAEIAETVSSEAVISDAVTDSIDAEAVSDMRSYEIQEGDTLIGISQTIYDTDSMVDEICEYNNIENSDDITAGDKILLP